MNHMTHLPGMCYKHGLESMLCISQYKTIFFAQKHYCSHTAVMLLSKHNLVSGYSVWKMQVLHEQKHCIRLGQNAFCVFDRCHCPDMAISITVE